MAEVLLSVRLLARQAVLALVAVVALTVGGAAPAVAHTALSSTTPTDGAELADPPSEVVLQFTDEVIELGVVVSVTGPSGSVDAAPPSVSGATVATALPESLPTGAYSVDWRVSAADGHPISGTFSFTVGESATAPTDAVGPPVTAPAPSPAPPAATATAPPVEETDAAGADPAEQDGGASWAVWVFVVTAVALGLLVAALVFARSQRRR